MIDFDAVRREIAQVHFKNVDPDARYLIVRDSTADKFNFDRLSTGKPLNLVSHRDSQIGVPLRDNGIYKITADAEGHMEIGEGWVDHLVGLGVADVCAGRAITVAQIYAWANQDITAFSAELPPAADE
jgi:hypothetical protein